MLVIADRHLMFLWCNIFVVQFLTDEYGWWMYFSRCW